MDIESIVKQLMQAEKMPLNKLFQDRQLWEWRQEEYREVNNLLRGLRDLTFNLKLQSTFSPQKTVSSNPQVATATAGGESTGTYTLNVTQLATVASNVSAATVSADPADPIDPNALLAAEKGKFAAQWTGDGPISFTITTYPEGQAVSAEFIVDPAQESLNDVLSRISADSELGVTAFYDAPAGKVAIATRHTGDNNPDGAEILFSGEFLTGTLKLSSANELGGQNAQFTINGLDTSRPTNIFSINGVTFNLLSEGSTSIQVQRDVDQVFNSIKTWVDKYNEVIETINGKLTQERYRDYPPLTEEQKQEMSDREIELWEEKAKSGLLRNDQMVQGILDNLRQELSTMVEGLELNHLGLIGITTGNYYERGQLHLDEAKLRAALEEDGEGVRDFFTRQEDGLAQRLSATLDQSLDRLSGYAGSVSGFSLVDNSYISRQIRNLDQRIDSTEDRLAQVEERYWRQFTAMETFINQMNSQSAWLSQQLAGWSQS